MIDQMPEFEVYVLVDSNGDYAIGKDTDAARTQYTDEIGALEDGDGFRMVCLKVKVPLPAVVELTGTAPEQGAATMTVS